MSIDFKFRADASGVTDALKEVNESMQELSAADFAMGLEAVLGLFGKLKGAVGELGQMFSACTQAAAELEAVGTRLGVMLNDVASGDTLAASLQRMATNGVVPLQEYKGVFVEIVRFAMIFSTIWGGVAAMGVVKQLWSCVSAMVAMNAAGKGLPGIFRAIGKEGWILLITAAVEALMALYDKFFGSDKEGEEVTAPQEDFVAKAREQEERLRAENDAKLAEAARVELDSKRKQTLEVLRATESLEAFNEALNRVSDDVREGSLYFA